jgi:hypothetical protein
MNPDSRPLRWRKSSFSASGNCVEVAVDGHSVLLRDTKENGAGPVLTFTESEWRAFLLGMDAGEFALDRLRER